MFHLARVTLVLAASLMFCLPPGWCCWVGFGCASPGESCGHTLPSCCAHKLPTPPPAPSNGDPEPGRRDNCPCEQRQSPVLAKTNVHAPDLSTPALTALIPARSQEIDGLMFATLRDVPVSVVEPCLHLVHCVWLC